MQPAAEDEWVLLGSVAAPYGVKGWVHVRSYSHPPANILRYKTWYLSGPHTEGPGLAYELLEGRPSGDHCVALLAGCQSPEAARMLRHQQIRVPRAVLPSLQAGTYYWRDLVGLSVQNVSFAVGCATETSGAAIMLPRVQRLLETGSNDVLVVESADHSTVLIPFILDEVILSIDLAEKSMIVRWHEWF